MKSGQPSRTAYGVAKRRATHQLLDQRPLVLDDPIAVRILGPGTDTDIFADAGQHDHPFSRAMRAFMVGRSRYAEDNLHKAISNGVRQYIVLGAGLDTFAYRNPYPQEKLRVFEVDHPATQQWKREMLANAGIAVPASLTFAPVDFESQSLSDGLRESGFQFDQPAFCSWLGVTPYLTLEAFRATVRCIGKFPQGSGVSFEYSLERSSLGPREQMAYDFIAERVKAAGEPFQLAFSPAAMHEELTAAGFLRIEEALSEELNERYFKDRTDGLRLGSGVARLTTAWT